MSEPDLLTRLCHPQFHAYPAHGNGVVSLATSQNIADMKEAADEIERLRAVLFEVRSEINLSKAPKLMGRIEAALGISHDQQKVAGE